MFLCFVFVLLLLFVVYKEGTTHYDNDDRKVYKVVEVAKKAFDDYDEPLDSLSRCSIMYN